MANIKLKFRPSTTESNCGVIYIQITHNRVVRQLQTPHRVYSSEWDKEKSEIIYSECTEARRNFLSDILQRIKFDVECLNNIIHLLDNSQQAYTTDNIIAIFKESNLRHTIFLFMKDIIDQLQYLGKLRTAESYASTLRSFCRFRMGVDVPLSCINSELILEYEAYLKRAGVCLNTSSFYLRNLRAVYNRAVDLALVEQQYPFKYVYTGVCKTIKRAISLDVIKKIKALDLSTRPTLDFARDMFLFSFYTRGMSFIDMAYLRKKDLCGNVLSYRRRKTGQQLFIRWEKCMHDLLKKYDTSNSIYLLPILKPAKDLDIRKQYQYSAHNINHSLQIIGDMLGIRLTLYVARHSWASIARNKQIPISIISEALGHDSEQTTRIYLSSLESNTIDNANCMILKLLQ